MGDLSPSTSGDLPPGDEKVGAGDLGVGGNAVLKNKPDKWRNKYERHWVTCCEKSSGFFFESHA